MTDIKTPETEKEEVFSLNYFDIEKGAIKEFSYVLEAIKVSDCVKPAEADLINFRKEAYAKIIKRYDDMLKIIKDKTGIKLNEIAQRALQDMTFTVAQRLEMLNHLM